MTAELRGALARLVRVHAARTRLTDKTSAPSIDGSSHRVAGRVRGATRRLAVGAPKLGAHVDSAIATGVTAATAPTAAPERQVTFHAMP